MIATIINNNHAASHCQWMVISSHISQFKKKGYITKFSQKKKKKKSKQKGLKKVNRELWFNQDEKAQGQGHSWL